jgi:hypothetical protein
LHYYYLEFPLIHIPIIPPIFNVISPADKCVFVDGGNCHVTDYGFRVNEMLWIFRHQNGGLSVKDWPVSSVFSSWFHASRKPLCWFHLPNVDAEYLL